ncbi:UNVERIFIED_CONTAM: F-box protein [Sesamum calycinum]|uniref:F-box protein n=1 Tax=Sesamum calycinum TaxID=2727403 RepID=A0AAW2SYN2_9LAMI
MDHKVETQVDFLQCLETDVCLYIMSFLDDPGDVVRASVVSRSWHRFVIAHGLAKRLCLKAFPQLYNITDVVIASEGTVNSIEEKTNNAMEWEILERDHKVYAALLQALTRSKVSPKDCIANAISASSTDNYPDESVVNTLNPRTDSLGELHTGQVKDKLGKPIYSAKFVRFRMGHPKSPREIGSDLHHLPLQRPADDKFVWTYTSPEFPMVQENRLQPFELPKPVLCVGGYLQIELLGRVQRQEMDGLFYICVCYVRVLGRPLFPAFEMDMVEPDGKLLLKYYPENLTSALQSSSSTEVPRLRHLEAEMLAERLGLLEDLLRGIQQGPNNPFIWDEDDDDEINGGLVL